MSNIYRYADHVQHYQMPYALNENLASASVEQLRFLCFFHGEAQRKSKSELTFTADEIRIATGINPSNLGRVRASLVNDGLLLVKKVGRVHYYTVCDPTDKTPVPDGRNNLDIDFDSLKADVLAKFFRPRLKRCKPTDNGLASHCPFPNHRDKNPSFSVELVDYNGGRWKCDGCEKHGKLVDFELYLSEDSKGATIDPAEAHALVVKRLRSVGVKEGAAKKDVVFDYCDADGELISQTVRPGGDKKRMYRRRPNPDNPDRYIRNAKGCTHVLYMLPEVLDSETVMVVEGEPDVQRVKQLNLRDSNGDAVAVTTNANGAGKWKSEYTNQLRGKRVILCGDNDEDEKGLRHMESVKMAIKAVAQDIKQVLLPMEYRDISHYLESHTAQDVINLVGEGWLELPVQI